MNPTTRDYLNLAVIATPLPRLIADCEHGPPVHFAPQETGFRLPLQPYSESADAGPMLFWTPQSSPNLTAFMPHVQSGGYFVVDAAYQAHCCRVAQVRVSSPSAEYPINEFIVCSGGKMERIVRSMRDSPRWQFFAEGDVQPYENVAAYSARRIKDRLTRETALLYLSAWGAPVQKPEFWLPAGPCFTFARRQRPA
jgi:hypothetical protein